MAQPQIGDPISGAELTDLQAIADQKGMPLNAAIDRYAWNDNFALAVFSRADRIDNALGVNIRN